ncbi:hypothetical protein [Pseudoroseicyclus aestuarii]|uniref:hypothetical protein n=1 Tax=Pseudoroseicyclus aestuarii TaxID=1795041 RepID=UPI0011B4A87C|nr:hypothetical protein [Pseudoroseicyclus aestuarii]
MIDLLMIYGITTCPEAPQFRHGLHQGVRVAPAAAMRQTLDMPTDRRIPMPKTLSRPCARAAA